MSGAGGACPSPPQLWGGCALLLLEAAELVGTGLSLPRTLAGLTVTGWVGGTRQERGRASESSLLIHRDPDSGTGMGTAGPEPARAWKSYLRNKHGELS